MWRSDPLAEKAHPAGRQGGRLMTMYAIKQSEATVGELYEDRPQIPRDPLRKTVGQGGTIFETFQAIAYQREEQERVAADLLEREIWAVTRLLAASAPIWDQKPGLTLSFPLEQPNEPVVYRLELSVFSRLADLLSPTQGEQELIASTTPCWARVSTNLERHLAGYSDHLACSYLPIPMAEAVKLLGLDRIVDQIEAATRAAYQAAMNEARAQEDRRARLQAIERMFGWEMEPWEIPSAMGTQLALALLGRGRLASLPCGAAGVGVATGAMYAFTGFAPALIVFLLGMALIVAWGVYIVHTTKGG